MDREEFKKLYIEMRTKEQDLLGMKRKEYTQGNEDVLLNFKQSAAFLGCDPKDVCVTYMMKHIQSIVLAVKENPDLKFVWENPDGTEGLAQRFSDARNYIVLLAGLIEDQKPEPKLQDPTLGMEILRIFNFSGNKPVLGEPVCIRNDGTVSALAKDTQCIIGHRIPTPLTLKEDEIMVKVYGVVE